jgi:SulP family sulfate permease
MSNPVGIKRRYSNLPARSHYVSRTEGSIESSSYSISNHEIRQQTMSWTFRELHHEVPMERDFVDRGFGLVVEEEITKSQELEVEPEVVPETTPLLEPIIVQPNWKIAIYSLPAVLLAVMLTLLDAMSYGIIIFPHSDSHIPTTGPQAGISMFLVSTIVSQIVYSCGGSAFKGAIGSMMIEVMPFLHIMCGLIEQEMVGYDDTAILATIMISYASSTIMTGLVFLAIGYFKLGNMIQFFPRHILIGCIGGIGFFLLLTGVEITAKIPPVISFHYFVELIQPKALKLWASSFGVAMVLKVVQEFIDHPMLVPMFYATIPVIFYIIVFASGITMETLRSQGWLFEFESGTDAPFYIFWSYFNFTKVHWSAVATTIPTQLALTFFGILHVPINVPALSVSTRQDVDLSKEIIAHGISNIVSGLCGATQVLYYN